MNADFYVKVIFNSKWKIVHIYNLYWYNLFRLNFLYGLHSYRVTLDQFVFNTFRFIFLQYCEENCMYPY